jgi:hypothetical protein
VSVWEGLESGGNQPEFSRELEAFVWKPKHIDSTNLSALSVSPRSSAYLHDWLQVIYFLPTLPFFFTHQGEGVPCEALQEGIESRALIMSTDWMETRWTPQLCFCSPLLLFLAIL